MKVNTPILNLDHQVRSASIVRFFEGFHSENHIYTRSKIGINMQRYVSDVNTSDEDLVRIESLNKDAFTLTYLDTAQRLAYFI